MPIRHHFSKFDRITWLRSIGCVFYAPLDYENGLVDIISVTTFTTSGGGAGGTVTFDANQNAYLFQRGSGRGQAGHWNNLNLNLQITNNVVQYYTFLFECNFQSTIGRSPCVGGYTTSSQNTHLNGGMVTAYDAYNWHNYSFVSNGGIGEIYRDDILINSGFTTSLVKNYGSIQATTINSYVSIGKSDTNGTAQATNLYAKQIYVFNTALSIQTIMQVRATE
jgi:hypothetical protein